MDENVIFEGLEELLDNLSKEDIKDIILDLAQDSSEFRNEMFIDLASEPDEAFMFSLFKELNDIALEHKQTAIELSDEIMKASGTENGGGCSGHCSSCSSACASCGSTGVGDDEFGSFDDFEEPEEFVAELEENNGYSDEEIECLFDELNFCYEEDLIDYLDRYVPRLIEKEFVLSAFDLVSAAAHEALAAEASISLFAFRDLAIEVEGYITDIIEICNKEERDAIFGVLLNCMSFDFEREGMVNGIYEILLNNFDEPHQLMAKEERLAALIEEAESYGYDAETFQGQILTEGLEKIKVLLQEKNQ